MRRIQAVEILDFPWIPNSLRQASMAYLQFAIRGSAAKLLPKLRELLQASGERRVVDLCSGGGGPWPVLAPRLAAEGLLDHVALTDAFPDLAAFAETERAAPGVVEGTRESLDATRLPKLSGLRTIFNAFHHFAPKDASAILQNAIDARANIAVFEFVGREPMVLLFALLLPLIVLFAVPFLPRLHWRWLLWTYVIPALPLIVGFDGLISCLRVYSEPELKALVGGLRDPGYRWEFSRVQLSGPVHATYLIGRPPVQG